MKPETLNLISYSGGKDSGALALHLLDEKVPNLVLVMCDTRWEHPTTMRYAFEFARRVGLRLVLLDSMGMEALILHKGRAPSAKARFCTEVLKREPFAAYVTRLQEQGFKTIVWVGERAEESDARAKKPCDEYDEGYDSLLVRGIHRWNIAQVLEIHKRYGVPLNPLYKQGMGRVGCAPCFPFVAKEELAETARRHPWVYDRMERLEGKVGRMLFSPGKTPRRFCSGRVWVEAKPERVRKDGTIKKATPARWVYLANVRDVERWSLTAKRQVPGQVSLFPEPAAACKSRYGLCE